MHSIYNCTQNRVKKMSCGIMADLIEFGKELEKQMRNKSGIMQALGPYLTVAGSVAENTR